MQGLCHLSASGGGEGTDFDVSDSINDPCTSCLGGDRQQAASRHALHRYWLPHDSEALYCAASADGDAHFGVCVTTVRRNYNYELVVTQTKVLTQTGYRFVPEKGSNFFGTQCASVYAIHAHNCITSHDAR